MTQNNFFHTICILILVAIFGLSFGCATKHRDDRFVEAKLGKVKFKYDAESPDKVKAVVAEYLTFMENQKIKDVLVEELPESWRAKCKDTSALASGMGDDCKAMYVISARLPQGFYSSFDRRFVHESCENNVCTYSISNDNYAVE